MANDKGDKGGTWDRGELRRQAELRFRSRRDEPVTKEKWDAPEMQRLIHELEVHQIELEMQNEELRRARAEVEDGLARFTELYDFAPIGYLTLGPDGTIREVNLTGARLLGHERSRLVGVRLASLVALECYRTLDDFLAKAFASQAKEGCELMLRREGAAPATLELTGTVWPDRQECRVVFTDVSQRKQFEQHRLEMQQRLEQAHKMEAIGTLAGGIAHDFNNILTGILGNLSLLQLDFGEDKSPRSSIQDMKDLVRRGADLTRQLLGFACRGKYDLRPLNLARLTAKASAMFGHVHKNITLELDLARDMPAVLMDRSQFDQMLLNLLVNAAQAMPAGGRLRLGATCVSLTREAAAQHRVAPGAFVKLEVADTGVGMDAATQARIFEPFFTTKRAGQGIGLGLASVYGIVKSHAGFITVESAPSKGSTFTVFLPATDKLTAEEKTPTVEVCRGVGTILVVDDEEVIQKACARMLEKLGYDVLTASSGAEAVEIVRRRAKPISIVVLDMIMPVMSGRQTFDAIHELAPELKVLLCSGYSIDGQAQEILDRGCNGFLQKPFDLAILSAEVRRLLLRGPS